MAYEGAILTDSGGYQVYSLSDLRKIVESGVHFKSHLDGSAHFIGPNESMQIQRALGSDIVMAFDECPSLPSTDEEMMVSVERTLRWAKSCRDYNLKEHQHLFGIIQGGLNIKTRSYCLDELKKMDFPGYAMGGLSVGEKNEEMVQFLNQFTPLMPAEKPRYLMGVGTPLDILNGVKAGIDMFDCVLPCRNARNGQALTSLGPISIKQQRYLEDRSPLDPHCHCPVCKRYSKAYLRHLYTVGEYLAGQLLTYHNLHFYLQMMRDVRMAITHHRFDEYHRNFLKNWQKG
jgi:queuine tRNA-ribosyltransferase